MEQFSRLGIGISSFVSVGDELDVSGTDMLLWWEADDTAELAVLYLESFGRPRRFARTARRVTAKIPVLTVHAGRSVPGQRAAASHTAATAAPLITRQALFEQAESVATPSFGELIDAAVLMAFQPIPAGQVVAIVSNGGGALGVLAADACAEAAAAVATTTPGIRSRLREVLPPGSALAGPVDTTDDVSAEAFREALQIAAAQDGVDAVIALVVRRGPADLVPGARRRAVAGPGRGGRAGPARGYPAAARYYTAPSVPAYAYPEAAARALARAARYGSWRSRPADAGTGKPARGGRAVDHRLLPGAGAGRWLAARRRGRRPAPLLWHPDVEFRRAGDADAAVEAAARLGGHVVIKADVPGLLHKTTAGAVELDLHGDGEVRAAMSRLQAKFAGRMSGALVEPMITGGVETIVGVVQEPVFGPVVVFGLGGVATEVLGDHAAAPVGPAHRRRRRRPDPLHPCRASSARAAGQCRPVGRPPQTPPQGQAADIGAVRDTLLRVSRLADDLPQVAELDLNPVIALLGRRHRRGRAHPRDQQPTRRPVPARGQLPSGSRTAGGPSPA